MKKQKVVLAYSGGLDTSYCIKYLTKEKGLEVHAVTVDTGGFSHDELKCFEEKALHLGAVSFKVLDKSQEYYSQCLKYLIFGNVLKNGAYPLSVSAERVFQAKAIAEFAKELKADFLAHGSTGAGNDQVRFDVIFRIIAPDLPVITPIRDQKLSREEEVDYLKGNGLDIDGSKSVYSINQGLWGTTIGGKETLTSQNELPEESYPDQLKHQGSEVISIQFNHGEPVGLDGIELESPVTLVQHLEQKASAYAIGRDIHVGDTVIGIKGRVGFAAAGPMILIKSHKHLEKHTLTRWQLQLKDQLAGWYGTLLHDGQFLEPAMRNIESFLESTQKNVTGTVRIKLAPYRFEILGIDSPHDLMTSLAGAYGEMNNAWDGQDVRGFSKIMANQAMVYKMVNKEL